MPDSKAQAHATHSSDDVAWRMFAGGVYDCDEPTDLCPLHAAAPEMAEALEDLHSCLGTGEMMASPWWRKKREAIEDALQKAGLL